MKKVELKLSHSTVTGNVVSELSTHWILSDVTVVGIKETRYFESWSVPKSMIWHTEEIK